MPGEFTHADVRRARFAYIVDLEGGDGELRLYTGLQRFPFVRPALINIYREGKRILATADLHIALKADGIKPPADVVEEDDLAVDAARELRRKMGSDDLLQRYWFWLEPKED